MNDFMKFIVGGSVKSAGTSRSTIAELVKCPVEHSTVRKEAARYLHA